MDRKELIKEINERLTLVLTISIFFSAFLGTFFELNGLLDLEKTSFGFISLMIIYLLSYVIFQFFKNKALSSLFLKLINGFLLLGISWFILPIIIMLITTGSSPMDKVQFLVTPIIVKGSIYGLPVMAFLVLFFILSGSFSKKD